MKILSVKFAREFTSEINPVLIFSEKEVCPDTSVEIRNMVMLAGKLGRTSAGVLCLKENNNTQGLIDNGLIPGRLPGNNVLDSADAVRKFENKWGVKGLPTKVASLKTKLTKGEFSNIFIFGEDPAGCAVDKDSIVKMISSADFMVVQDYFITDTALLADLILPATYPFETGGSFTNTQRFLQRFEKQLDSPVERNNLEQLSSILNLFSIASVPDPDSIMDELFGLIDQQKYVESFVSTEGTHKPLLFRYGADALKMSFCEYFKSEMEK